MFPIYQLENFLSEEDFKKCLDYSLSIRPQKIIQDKSFSEYIWKNYQEKLKSINSDWIGLHSDITLSNSSKPIAKHLDQKRNGVRQKLLIYLNDLENGGTIFYTSEGEILVENRKNRLVCFDINLHHAGQNFTEGRKISIGFRPKF